VSSTLFRLLWSLVTLLLLAALIAVVRLVWLQYPPGSPSAARPTPRVTPSPVATAQSPTPTPIPTVELAAEQRVRAGGFAFRPPVGYSVETDGPTVFLFADAANDAAPVFQLSGGSTPTLADSTGESPAALLTRFAEQYVATQSLTTTEVVSTSIHGLPAAEMALLDAGGSPPGNGRIVWVQPAPGRSFVAAVNAPGSRWPVIAREFDVLLDSIDFFEPTSGEQAELLTMPAPSGQDAQNPTPQAVGTTTPAADEFPVARATISGPWRSYSNANVANAVTASFNTIWVASDGGVVAWNKNNGAYAKYTTLDGLAANRTTSVVNCPLRGFGIIFGSESGLQIFDVQSSSWKILNSSNSGMSFDDVSALHCDAEHRTLTVGYKQHGVDRFDANSGTWRYIGQNDGLQNNLVETLAMAADQDALWVSSGLGISVLDADGQVAFYDEANSALETNQIRRIVVDGNGVVWLGAQDALYRVDGENWSIYDQREVLSSRFPAGALNGLAAAADGTLWIGSSRGEVCHFDPVRIQCLDFFAGQPGMVSGELTSLSIGADGAIYYTTAGGGVSMYTNRRWRAFVVPNQPLAGNEIHSLAQTSDGNLWVATERGIQAIDPATDSVVRQFTRDEATLLSATKEVLHAPPDGGLWFGAVGASYFNGLSWRTFSPADGLAGSLVQAIATDSQGRTWFGAESGLSIWNGSTFFNLTRENGLPSDNILALLADDDVMWISAAGGGLFRFERNQLQLYSTENSDLPAGPINAIAKSADGVLLIGHNRGLARFEDGNVTPFPALNGIAVSTIATTAEGVIWVGTGEQGLFYFDGEEWSSPPANVQTPSPQISQILIDQAGSVWVGARTGGLLRYTPPAP
jgi:ligand-binding sensor domain-containing protein